MGTGSFPGGKVRPERAADPSPPFKRQGRGIVELYLYPTPGHNRACNGVTLPFLNKLHWRLALNFLVK